jgi:tetratricopeptide (TPR) repeat protein
LKRPRRKISRTRGHTLDSGPRRSALEEEIKSAPFKPSESRSRASSFFSSDSNALMTSSSTFGQISRNTAAYESLAYAYIANGKKELALEYLKKTLELDPDNRNAAKMIKQLQKVR